MGKVCGVPIDAAHSATDELVQARTIGPNPFGPYTIHELRKRALANDPVALNHFLGDWAVNCDVKVCPRSRLVDEVSIHENGQEVKLVQASLRSDRILWILFGVWFISAGTFLGADMLGKRTPLVMVPLAIVFFGWLYMSIVLSRTTDISQIDRLSTATLLSVWAKHRGRLFTTPLLVELKLRRHKDPRLDQILYDLGFP